MAAQDPKSRKQSAASSGSTLPNPSLIFFIDRSLGQKVIAERLRQSGVQVEVHDDHFPQNASDEDWISEVGKRGWVVLTKDDRIRYRPAALTVYRRHQVKVFVFGSGEMKAQEMADAFVTALPKISREARERAGPYLRQDFKKWLGLFSLKVVQPGHLK